MLRKRLSLILDNVDEQCPADIAYVHSVYAPLSVSHPFNLRKFTSFFKKVRLVQQLDKPGWRNMRDVLDLLPGPSFEDTQQVAAESRPRSQGGPKVPRWTFQFWKYKLHFSRWSWWCLLVVAPWQKLLHSGSSHNRWDFLTSVWVFIWFCYWVGGEQCGVPGGHHLHHHWRVLHWVSCHQVGGSNVLRCLSDIQINVLVPIFCYQM